MVCCWPRRTERDTEKQVVPWEVAGNAFARKSVDCQDASDPGVLTPPPSVGLTGAALVAPQTAQRSDQ